MSCRTWLVSMRHEGPSPTPTLPPTSRSEDFRTSVSLLVFGSPRTFPWEPERLARGVEASHRSSAVDIVHRNRSGRNFWNIFRLP